MFKALVKNGKQITELAYISNLEVWNKIKTKNDIAIFMKLQLTDNWLLQKHLDDMKLKLSTNKKWGIFLGPKHDEWIDTIEQLSNTYNTKIYFESMNELLVDKTVIAELELRSLCNDFNSLLTNLTVKIINSDHAVKYDLYDYQNLMTSKLLTNIGFVKYVHAECAPLVNSKILNSGAKYNILPEKYRQYLQNQNKQIEKINFNGLIERTFDKNTIRWIDVFGKRYLVCNRGDRYSLLDCDLSLQKKIIVL